MRRTIYPILILLHFGGSYSAFGKDFDLKKYNVQQKKYELIAVTDFKGLRVTKNCFKNKSPQCEAWSKVTNKKIENPIKSNTPLVPHPAARKCEEIGGINMVLLDMKRTEIDYCFFKDQSAINSWDLYHAYKK